MQRNEAEKKMLGFHAGARGMVMRRFLLLLMMGVQLSCLGLLWISCFPGGLENVLFIVLCVVALFGFSPVGLPLSLILLAIGGAVGMRHFSQRQRPKSGKMPAPRQARRYPRRCAIATVGVILLTAVLLPINLPQKLAFALSRPAFEAFLADSAQVARFCDDDTVHSMNQPLGWYRVEACDRDPRGGVYFKTAEGSMMVWYSEALGFAYRPNPQGSHRFGKDPYKYGRLVGDWYWFKAGKNY